MLPPSFPAAHARLLRRGREAIDLPVLALVLVQDGRNETMPVNRHRIDGGINVVRSTARGVNVSNNGPLAAPGSASSGNSEGLATAALGHMEQALELLDRLEGPDDVGAHLDLAIHRLRDWIDDNSKGSDERLS